VTALKIDPYVNVDAGTMNPIEHGEVFVTDDGDETDQDMGNYERFLDIDLLSDNYMTTGRVYLSVIQKEREMKYKGKCVEVVPHIPEEVIHRVTTAAEKSDADITIVEVGGTAGEYQNILFLEAARMMKLASPSSVAFVLVSYMPVPSHLGEMKTKPTQHASRALNSAGINADMIIARGKHELDAPRREKLGIFCGVYKDNVISAPDVSSIYEIPMVFEEQGVGNKILKILSLEERKTDLSSWIKFAEKIRSAKKEIKIAVVGKYFNTGNYTLLDSYISVIEAIKHAAWHHDARPVIDWIDSELYEKTPELVNNLDSYDGIIVPGGFGTRGVEGIINAIKYCREHNKPYLGICYGMQLLTIEFVRNVLGLKDAHTVEVNSQTPNPVIHISEKQIKNVHENRYGGTMRLGAFDCALRKDTKTYEAYGTLNISERHRHRYEFNNSYREKMDAAGLKVVGINPQTDLVEIVELSNHPFCVGTQFHPEFKTRPMRPHPLFRDFVKAGLNEKMKKTKKIESAV
jgi:CTP synthase